jgi:hypothetical protein
MFNPVIFLPSFYYAAQNARQNAKKKKNPEEKEAAEEGLSVRLPA